MPLHRPSKGAVRSGLLSGTILFIVHLKYFAVSEEEVCTCKVVCFSNLNLLLFAVRVAVAVAVVA